MGHTLSGSGVAIEGTKLEAIQKWPEPSNLKQLRAFLGLTGYYRRFVKSYASIAALLIDLLKNDFFLKGVLLHQKHSNNSKFTWHLLLYWLFLISRKFLYWRLMPHEVELVLSLAKISIQLLISLRNCP